MKGVILAGGKGTRLLPATKVVNKHMIPILNKPMITYPLNTLKALGCDDILIVSGGEHIGGIAEFLGGGSVYGIKLTYKVQEEAGGIAQALGLAEDFYSGSNQPVIVILGDNIYDNEKLLDAAADKMVIVDEAVLFLKEVDDPQRFGVAEIADNKIVYIEEKPKEPRSKMAVTGLYVYPPDVFSVVPKLKPSDRGELEITDINNHFVTNGLCTYVNVDGFWSDAGTIDSLKEVTDWAYNKDLTNGK